ncbi:caffeoylshikimate esterase-like [Carica papaya]|uniref:caffeoylshikimate esterase-like n=1 Tax=Carica papaya TaxID=3649 RepID=UPI000B8D04E0|nr:caffeoylshikimate esterase-like [Carica papaya]
MYLAFPSRFRSLDLSLLLSRKPGHPFSDWRKSRLSSVSLPDPPAFMTERRYQLPLTAKKRPLIEGVSEELNLIASQNLDYAPARRRVRSAFIDVQQQLDHCLFKMAPAGIRTLEWYEMNSRGMEIFCKCWMPELGVGIKGVVCFCHGYGDTCTFFFEGIARQIAAAGYGVYAMDYPGFGLSEGLHGYIPNFDELVDDVIEQYTKIKERPESRGLPHFILGQSMGGAVTLKVHLKEPQGWDGVVLVAPMCKIAEEVKPPAAVLKVLTVLSKVMPKAKLLPERDLAELAFRDLRKRKMAVYNVICYNHRMRLKTAMELLKATSEIELQSSEVDNPHPLSLA